MCQWPTLKLGYEKIESMLSNKEVAMAVKVCQRKDKPGWWVMAHYKGERSKWSFKSDKKAAEGFAHTLTARLMLAEASWEPLTLSSSFGQGMPTVGATLKAWLETHARVHCKESTHQEYKRSIEKQLVPAFGARRLDELKRQDVAAFIGRCRSEKKSRSTIRNFLAPLRAAYTQAVEDSLVSVNPVTRAGRLSVRKDEQRQLFQPLTQEESRDLLSSAKDQYPGLYPVLLCAVRTGLRLGELIGLQWGDVDCRGRFIEVRRSVVRGRESTPKNHKIRRVDMSPQLQDVLVRLKETRQLEAMHKNGAMPEWVFLSPRSCRWDEGNLKGLWRRCLEAAKLRHVRFHDLRHSFASLLIEKGAHPKYIQEQLGHGSIQITMDIYGHLFPNRNRGWVDRLDDVPQ